MKKYKTEQRKLLLSFFENSKHRAISVQDVYRELCEEGISMSAIYRNLSEMEMEGVVHKVTNTTSSSVLYQYIDPIECADAIHLKCEVCDTTLHLNHHIVQMMLNYAKEAQGFEINHSGIFMYGKCENCSQK